MMIVPTTLLIAKVIRMLNTQKKWMKPGLTTLPYFHRYIVPTLYLKHTRYFAICKVESHIPTITEETAGLNVGLEKTSLFQDIYWPEKKKYATSEHV